MKTVSNIIIPVIPGIGTKVPGGSKIRVAHSRKSIISVTKTIHQPSVNVSRNQALHHELLKTRNLNLAKKENYLNALSESANVKRSDHFIPKNVRSIRPEFNENKGWTPCYPAEKNLNSQSNKIGNTFANSNLVFDRKELKQNRWDWVYIVKNPETYATPENLKSGILSIKAEKNAGDQIVSHAACLLTVDHFTKRGFAKNETNLYATIPFQLDNSQESYRFFKGLKNATNGAYPADFGGDPVYIIAHSTVFRTQH